MRTSILTSLALIIAVARVPYFCFLATTITEAFASPPSSPMELWCLSDATHAHMEGLIRHNLLRTRTNTFEWLLPDGHDTPASPDGYVVLFMHFHERGLMPPPHRFF
jgi:hypothetical protein